MSGWHGRDNLQRGRRVLAEELIEGSVEGPGRVVQPQMRALSTKEKKELIGWKAHYEQDHIPFRRDCITCLETAGKDRMRKKVKCPQSYCLSLDISGPFKPGRDQLAREVRYMLVGVITIPVHKEVPLVEAMKELGVAVQPRDDLEDEGPESGDAESGEQQEPDLWDAAPEVAEPIGAGDAEEMRALEEKWRAFLGQERDAGDNKVKSLTFGVPLVSRHATEVIKATAQIYARVRVLCIPVLRVHTDRAREFASAPFRHWIQQRDLLFTMTAGDEPSGNGRVEREIGIIKAHVRTLMQSSRAPPDFWPMAFRQAAEQRTRTQLLSMGIQVPSLLPFGATLVAKRKTWFQRTDEWNQPAERVTCWGPAADMSMTSQGYYVCNAAGKWFRSTVLVKPDETIPDSLREVQRYVDEKLHQEEAEGDDPRPDGESSPAPKTEPPHGGHQEGGSDVRRRLHGKQPGPDAKVQAEMQQLPAGNVGMMPHDPPGRRCYGKQPALGNTRQNAEPDDVGGPRPILVARPSLQVLREGGECQAPNSWCGGSSPTAWAQPRKDLRHGGDQEWVMLQLLQHREMTRIVQDETARLLEGGSTTSWQEVCQAKGELEELEHQLGCQIAGGEAGESQKGDERDGAKAWCKTLQAVDPTENVNREKEAEVYPLEVLQTRTIPIEEVRRDLRTWIEPFRKEVEKLTGGPVSRLTAEEFKALKDQQVDMQIIPMKLVATRKPNKLKGRIVACGNLAEEYAHDDLSAGGACAIAVRAAIHVAANRGWQLGSIDVTGAFLQAPRRGNDRLTICEPPKLLQAMKLVQPGEVWRVDCALYGFAESPSDWARYRDECLRKVEWWTGGDHYALQPTPEKHLWKVLRNHEEVRGVLCVYVDDILAGSDRKVLEELFSALKRTWVCSPKEYVSEERTMKFCGYDIRARRDGGYEISQHGYLKDLLDRRKVTGCEKSPGPKIKEGEDEPWDREALQEAQAITGEMQWIANRTRPDVTYITGLMARMLHRRPKYVVELGRHLLRYLRATVEHKLTYKPLQVWEKEGKTPELGQSLGSLEIFSDASYAPPHEQYRSVQGLLVSHGHNPLLWASSRQAFIVQSTAEAELLSYNESYQAGESIGALLEIFGYCTQKRLYGDNKAALVLCTGETGPWRTRHLRLRAAKLREAVQDQGTWTATHLRGDQLVADGLTKSLLGQSFDRFVTQLHLGTSEQSGNSGLKRNSTQDKMQATLSIKKLAIPGILAATSAALISAGRKSLGAVVGLCAGLTWLAQDQNQELTRKDQEATRKNGDAHQKAQDGKPESGGATRVTKAKVGVLDVETAQDGKPCHGGATRVTKDEVGVRVETVQDGKPERGGATINQKTEVLGVGQVGSPALRAFRVRFDLSHEPADVPRSLELGQDGG